MAERVRRDRDEEQVPRAGEEIAPREKEAGTWEEEPAAPPRGSHYAVDENRPADLVGQTAPREMTAPRLSPNPLHRQNVIVPQGHRHTETPGQELAEAEEE